MATNENGFTPNAVTTGDSLKIVYNDTADMYEYLIVDTSLWEVVDEYRTYETALEGLESERRIRNA